MPKNNKKNPLWLLSCMSPAAFVEHCCGFEDVPLMVKDCVPTGQKCNELSYAASRANRDGRTETDVIVFVETSTTNAATAATENTAHCGWTEFEARAEIEAQTLTCKRCIVLGCYLGNVFMTGFCIPINHM